MVRKVAYRRLVVVPLLGLVATLTGCADDSGSSVASYTPDETELDTVMGGTLAIADGCVTITGPDGVATPAFDGGAELRDGVLVFRSREYADGARIELSGGKASDSTSVRVPEGCPAEHVWLVAAG